MRVAAVGVPILFIAGVVVLIIWGARRAGGRTDTPSSGGDLVAYLVLAIAVTAGGFGLAQLFATAFPGDSLVFDPTSDLATSLSAIVVSAPFIIYFWRRQAQRRQIYPESVGWTIYLSYVELVFGIAGVVTAVLVIDGLFTDRSASGWTRMVVFVGVWLLHELAGRQAPPRSDGAELQVVVGSAIGLVTLSSGLGGLLGLGLLADAYNAVGGDVESGYEPWVAMTIVGAAYWVYRWWRPRLTDNGLPLQIYLVLTVYSAAISALAGAGAIVSLSLGYMLTDTPAAGDHFSTVPVWLAVTLVGLAVWVLHRRIFDERSHSLRAYEYLMAATGLSFAVGLAVGLTVLAFADDTIVGGGASDVVVVAALLAVAAGVWLWFRGRHLHGQKEEEVEAWPRRVYLLGMTVILGLTAAGALISALFMLIRRVLDGNPVDDLVVPVAITVYAGAATWYLLAQYLSERVSRESDETISPFTVTLVTSHPGALPTILPKQATLRVIHRGDGEGVVTEELAAQILEAVGVTSSIVWVDDQGFQVVPARI